MENTSQVLHRVHMWIADNALNDNVIIPIIIIMRHDPDYASKERDQRDHFFILIRIFDSFLLFLRDIASTRVQFPSIKCTLIVDFCVQHPTKSRPRIQIVRVRWLCFIIDMKTRVTDGGAQFIAAVCFLAARVYLLFSTAPRPWLGIMTCANVISRDPGPSCRSLNLLSRGCDNNRILRTCVRNHGTEWCEARYFRAHSG